MEKIPTAEEKLKANFFEAALKAATENAYTTNDCTNFNCPGESVDEDSILESYPLDNIK